MAVATIDQTAAFLSLEALAPGVKHMVRWIPETRLISVYDAMRIVRNDSNNDNTSRTYRSLSEENRNECTMFKFDGTSRPTPVASMNTIVLIVMEMPGKSSRQVRVHLAKQLQRLMAGDVTLIPEIKTQAERVTRLMHTNCYKRLIHTNCYKNIVELMFLKTRLHKSR